MATIWGGSVFYGGLLGGILAGAVYLRRKGRPLDLWASLTAPAIPLFHVFGRVGCFLGGCCYGLPSAWGFVYRYSPVAEANGVSRFPVQLVEAAWGPEFVGETSSITVFIKKLRAKIEDDPTEPRIIETVWGIGYRLDPEACG